MSDPITKLKHSKRLHSDESKINKRVKLLREKYAYGTYHHPADHQPHRLHKVSGANCGNSGCVMCGNPRKMWDKRTKQEQSFRQEKLWSEV